MAHLLATIFGCAGTRLTDDERAFFRDADPLGFILFARNVDTPDQVHALVDDFRDTVGRDDAPVLIDQEGGRVQRLKPPHWRAAPSAGEIARLHASDPNKGWEAATLNAALIARELRDLGITVDCVPVLDVPQPDADAIIGDRAAGETPEQSTEIGRIICGQMIANGVIPVIKHLPGHGRATVDSHLDLPVIDTARDDLAAIDFIPFRGNASLPWGQTSWSPWGMTAHVVYSAIDRQAPATTSKTVIDDIIRGDIGFDGFLLSDDLSMKALAGDMAERTRAALAAGCDAVLHCNGDMIEMTAVAESAAPLSNAALTRLETTETLRKAASDGNASTLDPQETDARIRRLLGSLAA